MNIVVCGGGTAGWLSAFILCQSQPYKHNIIVVESLKIGIIGAGEASSGLIIDILSGNFFDNNKVFSSTRDEIDIFDFLEKTDGIPKYALHHINWAKNKGSYFAPVVGSETNKKAPDHLFNYVISEYGLDKAYLCTLAGQAYEANKFPVNKEFGVHFDGFKVGKYIREYLIKYYGVKHIDSNIKDAVVKPNGFIESLVLDNGQILEGDLFIDCTGFARVLPKKLQIEWDSYKKYLPVDTAIPFLLDYEEDETVEPITVAEALSSGWMWRTPLKSRRGCGYVYSSDFLTEDQAVAEAEKIVGKKVNPIKTIKFDSGKLKQCWKNNCIATGLSSSFIEPLEATSIHGTLSQLYIFCQEYLSDTVESTCTEANIKKYNDSMGKMYDNFLDFTVLHYQGGREDFEFWRYIKNDGLITPNVQNYLDKAKNRIPTFLHFTDAVSGADDLWKWSLAGLNLVDRDIATKELHQFDMYDYAKNHYKYYKTQSDSLLSLQTRSFSFNPKESISSFYS